MRILPRLALAAFAFAPLLDAQAPGHATMLNPNTTLNDVRILHDGDDVHVFGHDYAQVLHARSRDGGRTWPLREAVVGQALLSRYEIVVAGPGQLVVLATSVNTEPTYWRSGDAGTTWSPTAPLFPGSFGLGQVALTAHGPQVLAVRLSGSGQLSVRRSLDGGATWLPEQVLPTFTSTTGNYLFCARNGSIVDMVWTQNGPGGWQGMNQRSLDGGATWLPLPRIVGVGFSGLVSDGTNLLARVASTQLQRSTDGGASWSPCSIPGMPHAVRLVQQGMRIVVVGQTDQGPGSAVIFSVSNDGGATWPASPLVLPSQPLITGEATIVDGTVCVRFFGGPALDLLVTRDGGATWQLVDGPVDAGFAPSSQRTLHLTATGSFPSPTRYHAYIGVGSGVLGSATPGAGGIAPHLTMDVLPFQGATSSLHLENGVGGSLAVLGVSFSAPVPEPLGSGTWWPSIAPILLGYVTSGAPGQPGAGSFAQPLVIPVAPALVGTSFSSQAIVFDAASVDGFTVSNALQTWLR
jgi:hypothetical protein